MGCSSSIEADEPGSSHPPRGPIDASVLQVKSKQQQQQHGNSGGGRSMDALEEREGANDKTISSDGKYAATGGKSNIVSEPAKAASPTSAASPASSSDAGKPANSKRSTPPSSTSAGGISTQFHAHSSKSGSGSDNGEGFVREVRRALADLSPFYSTGADAAYFEAADLAKSSELMSLGLADGQSIATTKNNSSVDSAGSPTAARSVDSANGGSATAASEMRLEDFPQYECEWRQGQLLGSGSFGKVYLGLHDELGSLMAVKQVQMSSGGTDVASMRADDVRLAKLAKEVSLLSRLHHPNIVEYRGMNISADKSTVNIFMEYVPGGSIAHILKRFGTFSEKLVRRYTKEILQGLLYLHSAGVVHRDIKGGNILVDVSGRCKLADYGASFSLSEILPEGSKPQIEGTPYWMAPEVIRQQTHGRKVDIWSLGCTVIEMISGRPPWSSQFKSQISALYHIGSTSDPPLLPDNLSEDGKDFVLWCLERDPAKRPNVLRLLEHPFITEPYTGPATKVKLPPPERLKQSGDTGDSGSWATMQPGAATSNGVAADSVVPDLAVTPEQADQLEDAIAAFLRQEQEALKQTALIEQIKLKL